MSTIDWANLSFGYMKTDYNVRTYFKDGKWGALETTTDESINLHMAATCLHYGQEAFEGLKAFKGKDGKIRIFRMRENTSCYNHCLLHFSTPAGSINFFLGRLFKLYDFSGL